jgi:hypothetical protein
MLRVMGGPKRLCSGVTRRELLVAGGLGFVGLNAAHGRLATTRDGSNVAGSSLPQFGRAKNVILLYLFGGPSHLEMCDMKPDAPVEVRGQFKAVSSTLPGCQVCEHLPRMARVMDRVTVVRSLTHPWNFHGMQYATTGLAVGSIPVEETDVHPQHQPFIGSVKRYYDEQAGGAKPHGAVPDNIILPFPLSSRRPAARYAKPYGAYLGSSLDPIATEFIGEPTRSMVRRSFGPPAEIWDPYLGVKPGCRFVITPEAELTGDITLDRLSRRRSLLEQMESVRRDSGLVTTRDVSLSPSQAKLDEQRELAFSLLDSRAVREAFAIDQEPTAVREAYGMTLFGQATLQARRLIEAGCRFVTVVWDEFGQLNAGWDTHVDHYNRLKSDLLPGLDAAFPALLLDLESRGLLDETLVLVMNEMGRTPRFEGEGRGHWGRAYTNFFAGAGIKRGHVIGRTDRIGATVTDRPLTAKDILATIYHLIGIDPHSVLRDRLNRPVPLAHDGQVVPEMLT